MRAYYSKEALSNFNTPHKPALEGLLVSDDDLAQAIAVESHRWEETLRILADR